MKEITDYRTEFQKKRDALNNEMYRLYWRLRKEGLTKHRACELVGQKFGRSTQGVNDMINRTTEMANALFNEDGTITISLKDGQGFTFETVSEALNFCLDQEIEAKSITTKKRNHVDQKKAV